MANDNQIKIYLSIKSPFYSPVFLADVFLKKKGLSATYGELKGTERYTKLSEKENKANTVVAAAVSLHWETNNKKIRQDIYHFAQINCRDGFFLVGRKPRNEFSWGNLSSNSLFVHPGRQPKIALEYAFEKNGAAWFDKNILIWNDLKKMLQEFRKGNGDFIHLQGYWAQELVDKDENLHIVAEVGGNESEVPEYSFSSLMASEKFIKGGQFEPFIEAYKEALQYAATKDPAEIAEKLECFFRDVKPGVLKSCIEQYQQLGCWRHDGRITIEHYEKAKEIFQKVKKIDDLPYVKVVMQPEHS